MPLLPLQNFYHCKTSNPLLGLGQLDLPALETCYLLRTLRLAFFVPEYTTNYAGLPYLIIFSQCQRRITSGHTDTGYLKPNKVQQPNT